MSIARGGVKSVPLKVHSKWPNSISIGSPPAPVKVGAMVSTNSMNWVPSWIGPVEELHQSIADQVMISFLPHSAWGTCWTSLVKI